MQPNIALGHALRDLGHEVAFYTGGSVRSQLETEGIACLPFRELDESSIRVTVEQLVNLRGHPLEKRDLWRKFLVATLPGQLNDLEAALNGFRADAIVCDLAMWAPILVLGETKGLPVIPFSHVANCLLPGPEGPVSGLPLPHSRNLLVDLCGRAASRIASALSAPVRREANNFRQQHGLPPLRVTVTEFAGRMPLYLVPSAPEFDYLRKDLPASVHYTGPCLWDRPKDHEPPDFLAKIDRARKCIVVDEGGLYKKEPRLFELAVAGLRNTPVQVILIAGDGRDPETLNLGPLPPTMTLSRNTPLSDVLPVADLLLTNGNSNAVLAALSCGVPVVVLPSIWDQAEVAWCIHETGTGLRVAPRRCTPERLRSAVMRVLEQTSFRENAERMAVALRRPGGPARAACLIEKLAKRT